MVKILVEFPNGKTFLNVIKTINSVNSMSARFMFRRDYVEIKELSIDRVSYIDVLIPYTMFLTYEIDREHDIIAEPKEIINALKGVGHQSFKLMILDDYVTISNGIYTYNLNAKSCEYEDDLKFNIKHNVMFEMYSDEFKNIIDIINRYLDMRFLPYEKVVIDVDNNVRIKTEDENINIQVNPIKINVIENSTSKYNVKELNKIMQHLSRISKTIEIMFSTEQPLELSIDYPYKIKYLLAPMI